TLRGTGRNEILEQRSPDLHDYVWHIRHPELRRSARNGDPGGAAAQARRDVRQQRSKKGHKIEPYPKTDAGIRDIDLHPDLAVLVKEYIGSRRNGFLFETTGGLPLSPRNITRDSLHPILKEMGRESAGFYTFRRFRESILQMSEARTLLIDYWMGHTNGEMSGGCGKQLLDNVQWRQECAAKVGLGFVFLTNKQQAMIDKSGQVYAKEEEAVAV